MKTFIGIWFGVATFAGAFVSLGLGILKTFDYITSEWGKKGEFAVMMFILVTAGALLAWGASISSEE
jgi:hypothetical protein